MYTDTFVYYSTAANRQLVGRVGLFFNAFIPDKVHFAPDQFDSDCVVQRKLELQGKKMRDPNRFQFFSYAINELWFATYIAKQLDRVHDYHIAE